MTSKFKYGWVLAAATLAMLTTTALPQAAKVRPPLPPGVSPLPKVGIIAVAPAENIPVEVGAKPFTDSDAVIESVAPELVGLSTARFAQGGRPMLGTTANVQLLIGYFKGEGDQWAKPPAGSKPVIENATKIKGMPDVDVYTMQFRKNNYRTGSALNIGSPGTYVLLGVIPGDVTIKPRDAKGGEAK